MVHVYFLTNQLKYCKAIYSEVDKCDSNRLWTLKRDVIWSEKVC